MILCGPVVEYTRHHGFCGFTGQTNNTTELSAFAELLSFLLDRGSIPANAGVRLFYDYVCCQRQFGSDSQAKSTRR